jgi:hypothetical protein
MPQQTSLYLYEVYVLAEQPTTSQSIASVIELLVDSISLGIHHLVVRLDSQLVVLQLSNVYSIRSPTLLRVYLRIHLLERYFDHIEYQHIPRCLNTLTDALANYVLDMHLNHL